MKPRQRQAAILEYLQKQGKCSVEELAHTLTPQAQPFAKIWSFWNMPEPSFVLMAAWC